MQNLEQTILSQFANSPIILALANNFNAYVDPSANIDAFYNNVWNISTAQGYGLDVWGRILNVTRILQVPTGDYFGFNQQVPGGIDTFGYAPLYAGETLTENYNLTDTAFLVLLLAKALANICDGSTPMKTQLLLNLFPGRGDCYVEDGLNMTETAVFNFTLTSVELAIIGQSGVYPRTTGVAFNVVIL